MVSHMVKIIACLLMAAVMCGCSGGDKGGTWRDVVSAVPDGADAVVMMTEAFAADSVAGDARRYSLMAAMADDTGRVAVVSFGSKKIYMVPTGAKACETYCDGASDVKIGDETYHARVDNGFARFMGDRISYGLEGTQYDIEKLISATKASSAKARYLKMFVDPKQTGMARGLVMRPEGCFDVSVSYVESAKRLRADVTNLNPGTYEVEPFVEGLVSGYAADVRCDYTQYLFFGVERGALSRLIDKYAMPHLKASHKFAVKMLDGVLADVQGHVSVTADTLGNYKATLDMAPGTAVAAASRIKSLLAKASVDGVGIAADGDRLQVMLGSEPQPAPGPQLICAPIYNTTLGLGRIQPNPDGVVDISFTPETVSVVASPEAVPIIKTLF